MRDVHELVCRPGGVINNAKAFKVGFAPLPYYDDVIKQPLNSIIGGAHSGR